MMIFFEHCADIASVGIIVDFTEDTETYILYYLFLFSKFKLCQRDLHKKIGLSVKGNHDRAEKYIEVTSKNLV